MPIEFDWSLLKDIGIGGVGIYALHLLYKSFVFFIERWTESTEAINRNTETHKSLNQVFETFFENQIEYQKESMSLMKDTNDKVTDIHKKWGEK